MKAKIWLGLVLLVFVFWGCQKRGVGFSVAKISSHLTYNPAWAIEEPEGLEKIFSQPYVYLRSGSQSYAFVSCDGRYVIKFFRFGHLEPPVLDFFRQKRAAKKRQNLLTLFGAYKLAYGVMREGTGLLYLHLNKTSHLQTKLKVVDKFHRTIWIDLDHTEFIVQEKAELIFSKLKTFLDQGDQAGLDAAIEKVRQLIKRRDRQGISDGDHGVANNFGFVGDRAVQIDVGRLCRMDQPHDDERITRRIDKWLEENKK